MFVVPRSPPSVSIFASGTEEEWYFEWFKCRTAIKLPGSFVSSFWNTLLFQASVKEPAVLHAVLALSSVHRRGTIGAGTQRKTQDILDNQEQLTLQHYVKAMNHLKPHLSTKDKESFRVALITCVVFVCLEFLRGHFETAQIHLQNGLKVLGDMQMLSKGNDRIIRLRSCRELTDEWIVEAFSRLYLQVELFRHAYRHPCPVLQADGLETPVSVFYSTNEAWQQLERLLNEVFHLTHQGRQQAESNCESFQHSVAILGHQQRLRAELARWLDMFEAFKKALQGRRSADEEKCYQLLHTYHIMANIMAETCLRPGDESVFDSQTDRFILLIKQLATLRTRASKISPNDALEEHEMEMSRSIVDMGWIPPLYYTAVKCRIHGIRHRAITLLESTSHREGIWDARIAALIARKVIKIEERDSYEDVGTADEFLLLGSPRPQDFLLPILPESYRICEIEADLSGAPMDKILLFCKQRKEGMNCRVLLSEYDVHLRRWIDKDVGD